MAKLSRAKIKSDHPQLRDVIEPAEMNVGRGSFRRSRFNTTGNKSLSMETQNCNELARCCLRSNQKHVSRRFIPANFLEARQVSIQRYFAHITPRSIVFLSRPSSQFTRLFSEFAQQTRGGHGVPPLQNAKSNSQPLITQNVIRSHQKQKTPKARFRQQQLPPRRCQS